MALAVVAPGVALQRWLRVRIDAGLVLPLGLAFAAGVAWLGIATGHGWIFPAAVAAAALGLALPRRAPWALAEGPSLRGAVPPVLAIVAVLALVQYPLDRRTANGDFRLDDLERIDTAFHVGVTWELITGYPPQVPGLAGVPLSYHVGPHLIRAEERLWAGIHPYDALYRFDVTLWAAALVLALRSVTRAAGGSPLAVALAGWTPLATDFSFVFGWLVPGLHWWTELLRGNLLLSLVFANSVVPALALAAGVVVALERYGSEGRAGWLVVAAVLSGAVPFFKVFLAGQLLLGLGVAFVVARDRRAVMTVAAPCAVAVALLASTPGSQAVRAILDPLSPAAKARELLGWTPLTGATMGAWAGLWLLASLGLRLGGLPRAVGALADRGPARVVLAAMALSGWPLSLLFRITADGAFDEGVYLTVESGALLWVFTAMAIAAVARSGRRRWVVVSAAALLAAPSTVELVARKASIPADVVPARVLRAMSALEADSRPGDVVLMRPFSRFPPPPIVFAGRRVPFTHYMPYMRQFASAQDIRDRESAVREFFNTEDPARALEIAGRLDARYAYLFGAQTISSQVEAALEPLYVEDGVRLYRIPRLQGRAAAEATPPLPRR